MLISSYRKCFLPPSLRCLIPAEAVKGRIVEGSAVSARSTNPLAVFSLNANSRKFLHPTSPRHHLLFVMSAIEIIGVILATSHILTIALIILWFGLGKPTTALAFRQRFRESFFPARARSIRPQR